MSLPYLPLYVGDYEADTAHLSILEDGCYTRLLRLMWRTPGCSIPDDEAWIFRMMRARSDEEKDAIRTVIGEFCQKRGGRILSLRLQHEFKKADETSRRRSEAGKLGGRPKVVDFTQYDSKAGLSQDEANQKHPSPSPTKLAAAAVTPVREKPAVVDGFEREEHVDIACEIVEMVHAKWPDWLPPGDKDRVRQWLSEGYSRDTIEAAIEAKIPRMTGPPRSFRYFDACISDLHRSLSQPIATSPDQRNDQRSDRESRKVDNLTAEFLRRAAARST